MSALAFRAVGIVAATLLSVVFAPPASASDSAEHPQSERRLLGQAVDQTVAASADPRVQAAMAALRAKVRAQGEVRVIVGVRAAFAPEASLTPAVAKLQRDDIAVAQQRVQSRLDSRRAGGLTRFEFIPFIALQVNADELEALTAMAEVTDIEEDGLSRPALEQSVPLIRADEAWAAGYTGNGWAVAVLDTGVDKAHSFLGGRVVSEACYSTTSDAYGTTSVCPDGVSASTAVGSGVNCPMSVPGCDHGTHVAGIAAGGGDSFSGAARGAGIISINVASRTDSPLDCGTSSPCLVMFASDQIAALERVYALRDSHRIAAVNMSLGGGRYYTQSACDASNAPRKAIIDTLRSAGIATVACSGNAGYVDSMIAPACLSSAVSVGSVFDAPGYGNSGLGWIGGPASADAVSYFSNSAAFLDLLAPGIMINSSIPGGGFANLWGTSMAAPHVTGCWAILRQARPAATVDQIEQVLKDTGVPVRDWRSGLTTPRIDCSAALAAVSPIGNYQGLWWKAPAGSESGWGINFAHQRDIVFGTWFTYDASRKPWWLIAQLDKRAGQEVFSGVVWTVTGPPFDAVPFPPGGSPGGTAETPVGTMTAAFADAAHATIQYTVDGVTQTKAIVPQQFGPLPICVWGEEPDLALATNYQDLWWNPQESGWGVNFTHQGDIIFATWFTYDAARQPWWLIAQLDKVAERVYSGPVSTVTGPPFDAVPFPAGGSPGGAVETPIGTATATFADGNSASFAYTVNGTAQTKAITRQVFAPPGTVCR